MKERLILVCGLSLGLLLALMAGLSAAQVLGDQGEPVSRKTAQRRGAAPSAVAASSLGTGFTYQGQLKSDGAPVSDACGMVFRLYDDAGGVNLAGSPITTTVPVSEGLFIVELDFGPDVFDGEARWLGISVQCGGDPGYTSLGLQALSANPYAIYSLGSPWSGLRDVPPGFADGVDDAVTVVTGTDIFAGEGLNQVTSGKSVTLAVDFAGSGVASSVAHSDHNHDDGYWSLDGNDATTPGSDFLGTTDQQALELHVNSARALRLEPRGASPNLIGGYSGNSVGGAASGATIAGGGVAGGVNQATADLTTISGGGSNAATSLYASVGGGQLNSATASWATVGGGSSNTAGGLASNVGGGASNETAGDWSTISGGEGNTAHGHFATIGGGANITTTSDYATVSGGGYNTASGYAAVIGGGGGIDFGSPVTNTASGDWSVIAGGGYNTAGGHRSTIGGGGHNSARGSASTIGGGAYITVAGIGSTVAGGYHITVTSDYATVGGGSQNTASHGWATVGGGQGNTASGNGATVGGGEDNISLGWYATIGGGWLNTADNMRATIGGGEENTASGSWSSIGGGRNNEASGDYAAVPGGYLNTAQGDFSFAAGRRAKANHDGAFVWADSGDVDFSSTADDQFAVRADGGAWFTGYTSSAPLLQATQSGNNDGMYVAQYGDGRAGFLGINNTGNNSSALYVTTNGTGHGVYVAAAGDDGLRIAAGVGGDYIHAGSDADPDFRVANNGAAYADGGWQGAADFAELMNTEGDSAVYEPGDVLVISVESDRTVAISSEPHSTLVIGVYSERPGFVGSAHVMEGQRDDEIPVAVVGIVACKVSAQNGPIRRGDLLVTSSTAGHAMRADAPAAGTVLGKALESLDAGAGVILILVTLQ